MGVWPDRDASPLCPWYSVYKISQVELHSFPKGTRKLNSEGVFASGVANNKKYVCSELGVVLFLPFNRAARERK